jgi:toxin ParE1/3/4
MRVIRWEADARRQYLDILSYIVDRNPNSAFWLDAEVGRKLELLKIFPEIGRLGRVEGSRELIIHPNYILIYRVARSTNDIIRVLHARQQYP